MKEGGEGGWEREGGRQVEGREVGGGRGGVTFIHTLI